MKEKKVLVVGGGAIGGVTAAHMAEAGYNITLFDIDKDHVNEINKHGLLIEGFDEKKKMHVHATSTLSDKFDIVFLSVKSPHTKKAIEMVQPHLTDETLVVSLQNGINEEEIAKMIGLHRTIGAVVGWGCTNVAPGHLKLTSEGTFNIGRLDEKITPELKEIKKMLQTYTTTTITDNIMGHLWTKLLINCAIAPVGVSFGAEVNDLVNDKKLVPIMIGLTNELITVALESNVTLEKFEDLLDVRLLQVNTFEDYKRAVTIMRMAGQKHKKIKSTIWQDIEKGRKTEIDYLNGFIERKAIEFGISTPINKALIKLVKKIEQGEKSPSDENLKDFYEQVRIPKKWREYDFTNDSFQSVHLYNLPTIQKHKQATDLNAVHVLGLSIAFSKAFEKITNSLFGKIFIRKTNWEITNLVLSSFFKEMGKKFAQKVTEGYQMKSNDASTITNIIIFYLNNLHISYSIKKIETNGAEIHIFPDSDAFTQTAKQFGIDTKISLPFFQPFFKGISKQINNNIISETKKTTIDGEKIYQTILKTKK